MYHALQLLQPTEIGAAFKQAGVGVEGREEVVYTGKLIIQRVHLLNVLYGMAVSLVIQVQAVGFDVSSQKLEAVLVGLVVEFLFIQSHAL